MKAVFVFLLFCLGCNNVRKGSDVYPCLMKIEYDDMNRTFNPGLIKIAISDSDSLIIKNVKAGLIKQIIFDNIPVKDSVFFVKKDYYEVERYKVVLGVGTNYFKADTNKTWTSKDIIDFLDNRVTIVLNNNKTLHLGLCN